ncbi:DNA (cytosine-5-)-methyltransferase [Flagellimonas lutimaris]|uniref:Cytosine-specific methyltransferase n=1 Tax=Flagellimonas lutimaris TaxID=475082 RepID=A0A3A1NAF2_9FLAO|nr:DNA (cytosine-5-)-methyltransferase [Allomuricauda lutimaris]RIV34945.1 DNA (cytosine-5-)-methyltransferase [Allomuricauda lutimaris]|tara:strand:- start:162 stop:1409 length:1248 start_codon:yes stop_codon:yes gene_type:complete
MQQLKVCELFAGVGGFRLGLENTGRYKVVWSNQWEPSTKMQHASLVYEARFGSENHSNSNIETVKTKEIPDHDMLVGGFPCQDYSVATSLKNSKGLIGKKGVLWWSIHRILTETKNRPKYLFLENVDRLLKSPSNQRGRDFAVMLRSLSDLGYAVEWRVINAAEYGMPQRRRRVFFLAYLKDTHIYHKLRKTAPTDWILKEGTFSEVFPVVQSAQNLVFFDLEKDLVTLSNEFNKEQGLSPFLNTGVCIDGKVSTLKTAPYHDGKRTLLSDILEKDSIPSEYYIDESDLPKWEYLKGSKKEIRKTKAGFKYNYSEGSMVFPDALDQPSRTIITGEGGKSPSRFKHVVQTSKGLRRLLPVELERLNMFPDNHTQLEGISDAKRAFFMGNALVVGIVEKVGASLFRKITEFEKQVQS